MVKFQILATALLQLASFSFFFICALRMESESRFFMGWYRNLELTLAVGALFLSLINLRGCLAVLRVRALCTMTCHQSVARYSAVLGTCGLLVYLGCHASQILPRPWLGAFCFALATWLFFQRFDLLPTWFAGERQITDRLGLRFPIDAVEWTTLQAYPNDRARMTAGADKSVYVTVYGVQSEVEAFRKVFSEAIRARKEAAGQKAA